MPAFSSRLMTFFAMILVVLAPWLRIWDTPGFSTAEPSVVAARQFADEFDGLPVPVSAGIETFGIEAYHPSLNSESASFPQRDTPLAPLLLIGGAAIWSLMDHGLAVKILMIQLMDHLAPQFHFVG